MLLELLFDVVLDFFPKVLFYAIVLPLKVVWSFLLFIFSFGHIRVSVSWNSTKMDRYGLAFFLLLLFGLAFYFIFRGSYYFNQPS